MKTEPDRIDGTEAFQPGRGSGRWVLRPGVDPSQLKPMYHDARDWRCAGMAADRFFIGYEPVLDANGKYVSPVTWVEGPAPSDDDVAVPIIIERGAP